MRSNRARHARTAYLARHRHQDRRSIARGWFEVILNGLRDQGRPFTRNRRGSLDRFPFGATPRRCLTTALLVPERVDADRDFYNRIEAARAARTYPLILELFEQGAVTLTAVRLFAPHLTIENQVAVLGSATHKSKREIEELVCALKPRPDTPVVVRRLPTPRAVVVQPLAAVPSAPSATRIGATTPAAVECRRESLPEPQPAPVSIAPPAPERYRIQLTVSRETRDRFRAPRRCCVMRCPRGCRRILRSHRHAPGGPAQSSQRSTERDRKRREMSAESPHFSGIEVALQTSSYARSPFWKADKLLTHPTGAVIWLPIVTYGQFGTRKEPRIPNAYVVRYPDPLG